MNNQGSPEQKTAQEKAKEYALINCPLPPNGIRDSYSARTQRDSVELAFLDGYRDASQQCSALKEENERLKAELKAASDVANNLTTANLDLIRKNEELYKKAYS